MDEQIHDIIPQQVLYT